MTKAIGETKFLLQRRARHTAKTLFMAGALVSACGSEAAEPELDAGPPPGPASPLPEPSYATRDQLANEPPADAGVPTVIATHQSATPHFIVDDKRIYWTTSGPASSEPGETVGLSTFRSCMKDDCAGTLVTYWTNPKAILAIATNGTRVFFSFHNVDDHACRFGCVRTCPVEGCESGATQTENVMAAPLAADETHVYWLSNDDTLQRCPVDGCNGFPELVARAQGICGVGEEPGPSFITQASSLIAARRGSESATLIDVPKSKGGSMRDIANGIPWPTSFAVDATRIYWSELNNASIKSCPLAGCGSTHETLAQLTGYSTLIAARNDRVYWFFAADRWYRRSTPTETELFECTVAGCTPGPRRILTQITPCAIAVDDAHIYWRTAASRMRYNWDYGDGTILRIKR